MVAKLQPRAKSGPPSNFIRPASTAQFPMQQGFTLVSRDSIWIRADDAYVVGEIYTL